MCQKLKEQWNGSVDFQAQFRCALLLPPVRIHFIQLAYLRQLGERRRRRFLKIGVLNIEEFDKVWDGGCNN
jgi:hypothetical protein